MTHELEVAIRTFRQKVDAARAELETCADPELSRYLHARINQAQAEVGAMERSLALWTIEAEIAGCEKRWR